jgi:hypothetical protein
LTGEVLRVYVSIRDILQVNVHLHVLSLVPKVFSPGTQFLCEAFSSDFLLQSDRSADVVPDVAKTLHTIVQQQS